MLLPNNTLLQGGIYKIVRHLSGSFSSSTQPAGMPFGYIYEGIHCLLNKRVVIKELFLRDYWDRDSKTNQVVINKFGSHNINIVEKLKQKFIEKVKLQSSLTHPNIVSTIDLFEENGTFYCVMEYIDGWTLHDCIQLVDGRIDEQEAIMYMRQMVEAMKYVHAKNVLHLNLNPRNIMITKDGVVKLISFGRSLELENHELYYEDDDEAPMPYLTNYEPIELLNKHIQKTPAADIYSLGAVFYNMITGLKPPSLSVINENEGLQALWHFPLSRSTRLAVLAAMQLPPKNRLQSMDEFLEILDGKSVPKNTQINEIEQQKSRWLDWW